MNQFTKAFIGITTSFAGLGCMVAVVIMGQPRDFSPRPDPETVQAPEHDVRIIQFMTATAEPERGRPRRYVAPASKDEGVKPRWASQEILDYNPMASHAVKSTSMPGTDTNERYAGHGAGPTMEYTNCVFRNPGSGCH